VREGEVVRDDGVILEIVNGPGVVVVVVVVFPVCGDDEISQEHDWEGV
jgi:hypothetical protein